MGVSSRAQQDVGYYAQLELERDAGAQAINKAFRKLALKHHPDKHAGAEEAVLAFRAVAEAFEVLSEPRARALYDQYGEAGLKDGVPDGNGGVVGGKYRFSGDAQRIFETFFGSASPFGDIYGALADPNSAVPDAAGPAFYGELTSLSKPVTAGQPRPIARDVPVTLAQLYRGDSLTVAHSFKKLNADGVTSTLTQSDLRLQIQPGWASGYKVVFPKAGDEGPAVVPADVVFTLKETGARDGYRRAGHDLIYSARITLVVRAIIIIIIIILCDSY
ncbi:DnaJ domain-containing protein [Pavlovales sp. CCMP2436]|nr:DnaJ domain-containing protein [Pavlovales sp. CCMP2436]